MDAKPFRQGLIEGKSGIRPIDRFDMTNFNCKLGALVDGFNARKLAPTLDVRRADLLTRYAMVAAGLAFKIASSIYGQPIPIGWACDGTDLRIHHGAR